MVHPTHYQVLEQKLGLEFEDPVVADKDEWLVVGHGGKEDTAYTLHMAGADNDHVEALGKETKKLLLCFYGVVLKTSFRTAHLAFDVALIFVISYE